MTEEKEKEQEQESKVPEKNKTIYEKIMEACFEEDKHCRMTARCLPSVIENFLQSHQDCLDLFDCYRIEAFDDEHDGYTFIMMQKMTTPRNRVFLYYLLEKGLLEVKKEEEEVYLVGYREKKAPSLEPIYDTSSVVGKRVVYGRDGQLKTSEDIHEIIGWRKRG